MNHLEEMRKHFTPSKSKVLGRSPIIQRSGGWTTNGYWLIKDEFQPAVIRKAPATSGDPFDAWHVTAGSRSALPCEVKNQIEVVGNYLCAKVSPTGGVKDGGPFEWFNVYMLAMICDLEGDADLTKQAGASPLFATIDGEVVMAIMPCKKFACS